MRSTPLARSIAKKFGFDIEKIKGTGPNGRITAEDVKSVAAKGEMEVAGAVVLGAGLADKKYDLSPARKTIAKRTSESKFSAPHFYLSVSVIADELLKARQNLNSRSEHKVSLNSFLMKFSAEMLRRHPIINSTWGQDQIISHNRVDIAVAVARRGGLVTPVVRDCQMKGILQIDKELKGLVEKARSGSLEVSDYSDSTFTISNLGAFGVESFTGIINPPNSAILAVGKVCKEPVVDQSDEIVVKRVMKLTLSCDHRLVDGNVGAAFLSDLKQMFEYPVQSLY